MDRSLICDPAALVAAHFGSGTARGLGVPSSPFPGHRARGETADRGLAADSRLERSS